MGYNRFMKKPRTLGIDSSTTGVAWCIFEDSKPKHWGKIHLEKVVGMQAKLKVIGEEFPKILKLHKPDHVYIEKTIYLRSAHTARVLSYVVGALMCLTLKEGYDIIDIEPMVAKNFYKYRAMNAKFKAAATKKLGKAGSIKLQNKLRKSQIIRINQFNFPNFITQDDDINDACSISAFAYDKHVKHIELETSKDVALDLAELGTLADLL